MKPFLRVLDTMAPLSLNVDAVIMIYSNKCRVSVSGFQAFGGVPGGGRLRPGAPRPLGRRPAPACARGPESGGRSRSPVEPCLAKGPRETLADEAWHTRLQSLWQEPRIRPRTPVAN